jgi:beta-mannosidase
MELTGPWLAVEADDEIRRSGIGLDADDRAWEPIEVPGHWRNTTRFAGSDGPLMYRHSFQVDRPAEGRRRWITLDGIFYQADVWLDGAYLGDPEGYFFPHTFDVTSLSGLGDHHVLAVEVTCTPQRSTTGRRNITGMYQPPSGTGPSRNPGGLWRPVRMYETGPIRIDRFRVLCRDADERRAHLRIAARLDSDRQTAATIVTTIDGATRDEQHAVVAAGSNELEWTIDIANPALWWPRTLGSQELLDVEVDVVVDGELSDRRQRRTGLRQVTWDDWICTVNGERLFLKGANYQPTAALPADATPELVRADLDAAVDLGLDALRIEGHIADRLVYDIADQLGLLLQQDFPLQWRHARSVRPQAVAQARAAVDSLGHHPSIVLWNGHNDPTAADAAVRSPGWRGQVRAAIGQQVPSWNRSILDRWVKRAFERADNTREVSPHSGVIPHLPLLDGTDSHLWFGWRHGAPEDLATLASRLPRLVRFVTAFGSDSPPDRAPFVDDELSRHDWPALDWDRLDAEFGYQRTAFERTLPPTEYDTFDDWRIAAQRYQADLLALQIETLRRLKYRPTGGFCFSRLNDPAPAISSAVLDADRSPKLAYDAVRSACVPVIVVTDPLARAVSTGDRLDLDVHVVSDLRSPIDFAVVDVTASWPGGGQRWRFGGSVGADDVVKVGAIRFDVPDVVGPLTIDLTLTAGEVSARRHLATTITR